MEAQVFSVKEAAATLNISRPTVYELLRRAEHPLPSVRLGRRRVIPRAALERWLEKEMEAEQEVKKK